MGKDQNWKIEILMIGSVGRKSRDIQAKSFGAWIARTLKEGQKLDKNQT